MLHISCILGMSSLYLVTCNVLYCSTRYRGGLRGRQKAVIIELLLDYYQVESVFQGQEHLVVMTTFSSHDYI